MDFKKRTYRSDRLNSFAVRRIRQEGPLRKTKKIKLALPNFSKIPRIFTARNAIIISAIIALFLMFTAYNLIKSVSIKTVVFSLGKDLTQDQYGHTNILLLGTGGGDHEGADLTDTIILASIDQKTNEVTMLSIPRDLYVSNTKIQGTRINNLYHIGKNELNDEQLGLTMLRNEIKNVTNIEVQYFVKVEFAGFKEMVDALDGIDINVPSAIVDTQYPVGENIGYETFSISAGPQHLDGETALKYARSRHSTNDFDRSKRQQAVIYAMKEKAEKMGILGDSGAVKSLYDSLSTYIKTDLSPREIITLAKIGSQVKRDQISTYVVHDDPTKCGGLLYTPERALYGGASVLVAATKGNGDIHKLADIVLNHPDFKKSDIKLQILNGTKAAGMAAETKILLNRLCLNISRFGNGQEKNIEKTTYFLKTEVPQNVLDALREMIPGEISRTPPQKYIDLPYASDAQIILEIGQDYLPHAMKDPYDGIVDLTPKATTSEATPTNSTSTTTLAKPIAPAKLVTPKKK